MKFTIIFVLVVLMCFISPSHAEILHETVHLYNNTVTAGNEYFDIEIDYSTVGTTYATLYPKSYTGDIDVALGVEDGVEIESIQLYKPHIVNYTNSYSHTFYFVVDFFSLNEESYDFILDYGNEYNYLHYIVNHSVYNYTTEEWVPSTSVVAFDYVSNVGDNYTISWETTTSVPSPSVTDSLVSYWNPGTVDGSGTTLTLRSVVK